MNYITLDIGGTAIKTAVFHDSSLFLTDECPTEAHLGGKRLVEKIFHIIDRLLLQTSCDGIGISTAGQVNAAEGSIIYASENIPGYTGTPLKGLLEERYPHVPVFIENDVNAAALGEAAYGAGKEHSYFLCLTYGTGIGGAIIMNHGLFRGADGIAAEMGHIITHPQGLSCGCGHRGCYEQYASATALVRRASALDSGWNSGRAIFNALAEGNAPVKECIDIWIQEVSYGLISLIYIFNPSAILLGGGIMSQPYIIEQLQKIIYADTMESFHKVLIKPALLGNLAGVYGMKSILERASGILYKGPLLTL